jgi:hypothetical protein
MSNPRLAAYVAIAKDNVLWLMRYYLSNLKISIMRSELTQILGKSMLEFGSDSMVRKRNPGRLCR